MKQKRVPDKSAFWRVGLVDRWSKAFQDYIRETRQVTIKPGVSIHELEESLSKEYGARVRLVVPDF